MIKDIEKAIALIEQELPGFVWQLSRVTYNLHMMTPMGEGIILTLMSSDRQVRVVDKIGLDEDSALPKTKTLIMRMKDRLKEVNYVRSQ